MQTTLSSPTSTVAIGSDLPFVIIGERINPTGRSKLSAEMAAGNLERVKKDAIAQVAAGAHILDINAGIPMVDEPALLAEAIEQVQMVVDVPLCIDSSIVEALDSGLTAYKGKPLVNSVTGEEDRLEAVLPLVAKHNAAVIGIANDETGISYDANVRFEVAKKIVDRAESFGIPRSDVIIDPLAMPVGAVPTAGTALFDIVQRIRNGLGVNTVCGASNISFGLPGRVALNAAFLAMAISAGMTCAITNPLEDPIRRTTLAADVLMGHDENCKAWVQSYRDDSSPTSRDERRQRRRSRTRLGNPPSST